MAPSSRTQTFLTLFAILLCTSPVDAQIAIEWVRTHGEPYVFDAAMDLAADTQGNLYVVGTSGDLATIVKYAPNGDALWARQDGVGFAIFRAVALDADDGVFATGSTRNQNDRYDLVTVHRSSDGVLLWEHRYSAGLSDGGHAIALAPDGDILVAGANQPPMYPAGTDVVVLRYSPDGKLRWARHYDDPVVHLTDQPTGLVVDHEGNAYLTGYSDTTTDVDCLTLSYAPDGTLRWLRRYDGGVDPPFGLSDYGFDLILTQDGQSLVVVGRTTRAADAPPGFYQNWLTIQYDTATGDERWVRFYGTDHDFGGGAVDLIADAQGIVYITGSTEPVGVDESDWITLAYDSNGAELWAVRRDRPDVAQLGFSIRFAPDSCLVVAGAGGPPSDLDYVILGYDRAGAPLWEIPYAGPDHSSDSPGAGLAVHPDGSIYASGFSRLANNPDDTEWTTVKYRLAQPTPVELRDATLRQEGCTVVLQWRTSDLSLVYDVLRADAAAPLDLVQVNGSPLLSVDGSYHLTDTSALCGHIYHYDLFGLASGGTRIHLGTLSITLAAAAASALALHPPHPNPTRGATAIPFTLGAASAVRITFYGARGRIVADRHLGSLLPGQHLTTWDGTDEDQQPLPSGVYYYRLQAGDTAAFGRLVLAR